MNRHIFIRIVILFLLGSPLTGFAQPAFPEAEGYGMFTPGGRGGDVYRVTTLADYGPGERPVDGSLRQALEAEGPRTVVFRVSGTIELKQPLEVDYGRLTIAGQTAPGEGITLKNFALDLNGDDTVVRHLRVRPGDSMAIEQDAISIRGRNVILDHVTASWGTDETVSLSRGARNVTIQWSLIAESLNRSVHSKGDHGYGMLLSDADSISVHHTIYAFHRSRSPRPKDVLLDFRNNLIHGFSDRAGYNIDDFTRMNYVANYLEPLAWSGGGGHAFHVDGLNSRLFLEGNVRGGAWADPENDWTLIDTPSEIPHEEAEAIIRVQTPFVAPSVRTHTATDARELVLEQSGALPDRRDASDRRLVAVIRAGTGRIIDSQDEVGGWPVLAVTAAPADEDADGMPDAWEAGHGLDASNPHDHRDDADGDGYTNLEEYLNATDPRESYGWVAPPRVEPAGGAAFADGDTLRIRIHTEHPEFSLHYTLDGSRPDGGSARVTGPILLTGSAHLRVASITDRPTTDAFAQFTSVPWQSATPREGLVSGLRYAYHEVDEWDDAPALETLQPKSTGITSVPDPTLSPRETGYGLVYDGYLNVPRDGLYTFYLSDDARSRLFVGGTFVARGSSTGFSVGYVALREGLHEFQYRSLHETTGVTPRLEWSGPDMERAALSGSFLFHDPAPQHVDIQARNTLDLTRSDEVISLEWKELLTTLPALSVDQVHVSDVPAGNRVPSQVMDTDGDGQPDELLLLADFRPGETRTFRISGGGTVGRVVSRTFAMHEPNRDDVAWENDRIAFRTYGMGLWNLEDLVSSGIDVLTKRTEDLVLTRWYESGNYHQDTGEGADFFAVGSSLGAGGTAIQSGGQLHKAPNFDSFRILATGPIRSMLELQYGPRNVEGVQIWETKRIWMDAGSQFFVSESTYETDTDTDSLDVVTGFVTRAGTVGSMKTETDHAWLGLWGPVSRSAGGHGELGMAIIMSRDHITGIRETDNHYIMHARTAPGVAVQHHVGAAWTAAGHISDPTAWWRHVHNRIQRLATPIEVLQLRNP